MSTNCQYVLLHLQRTTDNRLLVTTVTSRLTLFLGTLLPQPFLQSSGTIAQSFKCNWEIRKAVISNKPNYDVTTKPWSVRADLTSVYIQSPQEVLTDVEIWLRNIIFEQGDFVMARGSYFL